LNEFIEYYNNVGANIDDDKYFEQMIVTSYKLYANDAKFKDYAPAGNFYPFHHVLTISLKDLDNKSPIGLKNINLEKFPVMLLSEHPTNLLVTPLMADPKLVNLLNLPDQELALVNKPRDLLTLPNINNLLNLSLKASLLMITCSESSETRLLPEVPEVSWDLLDSSKSSMMITPRNSICLNSLRS